MKNNWGKREQAPHRRVCCGIVYIYMYIVCHAVNYLQLLFCILLHHVLIQKRFTNAPFDASYPYRTLGTTYIQAPPPLHQSHAIWICHGE